jgi:hypothetical protein
MSANKGTLPGVGTVARARGVAIVLDRTRPNRRPKGVSPPLSPPTLILAKLEAPEATAGRGAFAGQHSRTGPINNTFETTNPQTTRMIPFPAVARCESLPLSMWREYTRPLKQAMLISIVMTNEAQSV